MLLKSLNLKYLVYALGTVIVIWLDELLVANPNPLLVLLGLFPIGLGASVLIGIKGKAWVGRYSTFLTWLAIAVGGATADRLSTTIISLAPSAPTSWLLVIGLGLFVVVIAFALYFVDIFRSGAFLVDPSKPK